LQKKSPMVFVVFVLLTMKCLLFIPAVTARFLAIGLCLPSLAMHKEVGFACMQSNQHTDEHGFEGDRNDLYGGSVTHQTVRRRGSEPES